MSVSREIKSGYRAITQARPRDTVKAYAEFHRMLDDTVITVGDILSASRQYPESLEDLDQARQVAVGVGGRSEPLLRGSGIIALGSRAGDILAVSYKTDDGEDLVEDKYPGYQKVVLRKLGQALLVGGTFGYVVPEYCKLQEILEAEGLSDPESPPHHLGYAGDVKQVASASGMLPDIGQARLLAHKLSPQLLVDYRRGWVSWEHDEFAGAIDQTVAEKALNPHSKFPVYGLAATIRKYHKNDLNVH